MCSKIHYSYYFEWSNSWRKVEGVLYSQEIYVADFLQYNETMKAIFFKFFKWNLCMVRKFLKNNMEKLLVLAKIISVEMFRWKIWQSLMSYNEIINKPIAWHDSQ